MEMQFALLTSALAIIQGLNSSGDLMAIQDKAIVEMNSYRYNCQAQIAPYPKRQNVSLETAKQLQTQMDGNEFIYRCVPTQSATVVSGTITYRQRMALPANAVIEVKLEDVTRQDVPAVTIAEQTLTPRDQQVPIPFALPYNPDLIDPSHIYVVRARILFDQQLRFMNTTTTPVLTHNHPNTAAVIVEAVKQ